MNRRILFLDANEAHPAPPREGFSPYLTGCFEDESAMKSKMIISQMRSTIIKPRDTQCRLADCPGAVTVLTPARP
jgi:hypothetical protein